MTQVVSELPSISGELRERIVTVPREASEHRALMQDIDAMNVLEVGGMSVIDVLPASFAVAAWNVERCLFPQDSAAHVAPQTPSIVLLSEMDKGMSRTGQRHTTADMAAHLDMTYVYGVEFFELDLGDITERPYCKDDFNAQGFHGNGLLTSVKPSRVKLIRLDDHGFWFNPTQDASDPRQPRVGGRMAVAALIPHEDGEVCVVSTHLESNATVEHRHGQFERLLDAIDDFAPDAPVVIGGDLNTGNHLEDADWRRETLFDHAKERGYSWETNAEGMTTRPSLITPHPDREMKLDWFCTRGVIGDNPRIISSLDADGRPLSDHDPIVADFSLI